MNEIFEIEGSDKRKDLAGKRLQYTQKPGGSDVEVFRADTGFILLRKDWKINYKKAFVSRAISAAKLSLGVPLELREFYYTLGATPDLMVPFQTVRADQLYTYVLQAINDLEILCDVGREVFTIGNLSKGFIYYYHSEKYADKERKVAFTENIARQVMTSDELEGCQNIIVVEKNAAATRLVELGFSELTNSVIVTVGGNFNRGIWELTRRFKDSKNMLFFADGDVYGVDMLRTIQVGTENSRHLKYKFPPATNPKIFPAGLFPSIGKTLGLECDKDQKRPSNRPATVKRINFLAQHGLLDQKDYDAWMKNDLTYELESLSTHFKDPEGKPLGLAIYLIEYMRLFDIPIKPPIPPDDKLKEEFDKVAEVELLTEIDEATGLGIPAAEIYYMIHDCFDQIRDKIIKDLFEEMLPQFEEVLEKVGAKEIKYHIFKQFEADPTRTTYDLVEIARKLKPMFDLHVHWDGDMIKAKVKEALEEWLDAHPEGFTIDRNVQFKEIHNETNYDPTGYDLVLQRLGAKDEDVKKMRQALLTRFMDDPRIKR